MEQIRANLSPGDKGNCTPRQRALIFDAVEKQLMHEPFTETRNKKPLRPNPLAPWELRIGNLWVFLRSSSR